MSETIATLLAKMAEHPVSVRFASLRRVCDHYFGKPRQASGSHVVYRTPWPGDPRVNIQNDRGKAKPYQVRQVLAAVRKISYGKGAD